MEEIKVYIFDVRVYNKKDEIVKTVPHRNLAPNKYVVDGEICIIDDEGNEHFNWIMKEITRKDHTIQNPHYKLFDILTYDEFVGEATSDIFSNRYNLLKYLKIVNGILCLTKNVLHVKKISINGLKKYLMEDGKVLCFEKIHHMNLVEPKIS